MLNFEWIVLVANFPGFWQNFDQIMISKIRVQGAYPVAALRGVRGSASLPERATEQHSYGSTHRWLVGRIDGWLNA